MARMKTSELTGAALDWAVSRCERHWTFEPDGLDSYSTDWALAGPIIEREYIELTIDLAWNAAIRGGDKDDIAHGPTPLIAAMRCYVASKLGDEVEIPEELQ